MLMLPLAILLKVWTPKGARLAPGIFWKFEGVSICQNDRGRVAFSRQGPRIRDTLQHAMCNCPAVSPINAVFLGIPWWSSG